MSTSDPRHYDVIIAPVITEKATMASEHNKVMFKVRRNATKPQIKEAVEKLFDVKVKNVNTLIRPGKRKVFKNMLGKYPRNFLLAEVFFKIGSVGNIQNGLIC